MILAVDIGNSVTLFGLFDETGKLSFRSALHTDRHATADQCALQLQSVFQLYGAALHAVTGGILASVVPPLTGAMCAALERLTGKAPLVLGTGLRTGLDIRADMHAQLGADILAGSVAAIARYPGPVIVADFGTAITFSVLQGNVYAGCAILPGVRVSMEALSQQAAELPHISLNGPCDILGHNTVDAMRSGAVYGYASLLDGMTARLEAASAPAATVVATGAGAMDILPQCKRPIQYDPNLHLDGLYLLYQKNTEPRKRRGQGSQD